MVCPVSTSLGEGEGDCVVQRSDGFGVLRVGQKQKGQDQRTQDARKETQKFTITTLTLDILLGHSEGEYVGVWLRPIDGLIVIGSLDGEGDGLLDG